MLSIPSSFFDNVNILAEYNKLSLQIIAKFIFMSTKGILNVRQKNSKLKLNYKLMSQTVAEKFNNIAACNMAAFIYCILYMLKSIFPENYPKK